MIEWVPILSIAGKLLLRFLDTRESELRKKKLELEIDELVYKREDVHLANKKQLVEVRDEILAELHNLVASTPGLEWHQARLRKDPVVISYSPARPNPEQVLRELKQVIDARRGQMLAQVISYEQTKKPPLADEPVSIASVSQEDAAKPQDEANLNDGWVELPMSDPERGVTDAVKERLEQLHRRIEDRRE